MNISMNVLSISLILAAAASAMPTDDLSTLSSDFWTWRAIHQPITGDDVPRIERPAGWVPDWSPETVAAIRRDLSTFEERWKKLEDPSAPVPKQVDWRLMGSALSRITYELDVNPAWRRNPCFYVDQSLGAVYDLLYPSSPMTAARGGEIVRRLASIPRTVEDAERNLDDARVPFARLAIGELDNVHKRLADFVAAIGMELDPETGAEIEKTAARAADALESYRTWLESRLPTMKEPVSVGRDAYLFFLKRVALIPYSPEEILAMGRQERARSVAAEVLARQKNTGLPGLPIFKTQDEQIARAAADELAVRRLLEEKGILTVPSSMPHYGYRKMPAYMAPLADFGEGTDFPVGSRLGENATRYIPVPSANLGYFALSMTQDPRADMVHEGVPGHAFQLAISWTNPDEIRRHWYDSGVNEGLGFYCEEMMEQVGLFDDSPKSIEMIANYMRLRALRVEVDVRLSLGTFTIDEAAKYLHENVPMDEETARGEAANFAASPGFAIGYQIGKLRIVKFLEEARRIHGDKFELRKFHDFVWLNGNVPIVLQRWELLGLRDEVEQLGSMHAPV